MIVTKEALSGLLVAKACAYCLESQPQGIQLNLTEGDHALDFKNLKNKGTH